MAKLIALVVLALVVVASAKPFGGIGVAHKSHHVSSHIVSPYLGLGYGMMGMGGMHHLGMMGGMGGYGMMGMKGLGMGMMYPGGIGMGYGMMG